MIFKTQSSIFVSTGAETNIVGDQLPRVNERKTLQNPIESAKKKMRIGVMSYVHLLKIFNFHQSLNLLCYSLLPFCSKIKQSPLMTAST